MSQPFVFRKSLRWGLLLAALLLGACAKVNDTSLRLVSTSRDAYLLVNGQVLTGTVLLVPDRTGRLSFSEGTGAINSCSGGLRYTASNSGEMDVRCNDGTEVAMQYTLLSETRGYGYGATAQGVVSIAFGLSESDALAFLKAPAGKKVVVNADSGALELQ